MRKLHFVHPPKSGGTSFGNVIVAIACEINRNTTGGGRRRPASFSTSARPRQASDESDGEADVLQGPDIHKVERILDMKVNANGGREFLIKWQGWSAKWNGAHSHNARVDFSNPQRSPNLANLNTRTRGTHPAL